MVKPHDYGIETIDIGGQSGSETRSQSQKSTCKDLKPKWPKPSHLGLRPLTLRFLNAPARALALLTPSLPARKLIEV